MRRYLPELIALPLLPLLIAQGRQARRVTPRLPEAAGPNAGLAGSGYDGAALRLVGVGESPVAGVGVASHHEAITGQFALALAQRLRRPVRWSAYGSNGVTVAQALQQVLPRIPPQPVDLALVAFGVNDTSGFRSVARWRGDLAEMLAALDARCAPRRVLLSGVPPVAALPALPQPLRWVLGMKARALDLAAQEMTQQLAHVKHVPLLLDTRDRSLTASDGYHPSAAGCVAWARLLADAAHEQQRQQRQR